MLWEYQRVLMITSNRNYSFERSADTDETNNKLIITNYNTDLHREHRI